MADSGRNPSYLDNPFFRMMPADVSTIWQEMFRLATGSAAALTSAQQASLQAATRSLELMTNAYARLWGIKTADVVPADKRFADDAWSENLALDTMKQAYLITSKWLVDMAEGLKEVDPQLHQRAVFYTKQFADALSPTNFPLTNPTVAQETLRTGGANLAQGMQNLVSDVRKRRVSQVPDESFVVGKQLAATPGKVVYRNRLIELIQYSSTASKVYQVPVLMIAPWVNKYYVLDMSPHNSMIRHLIEAGFTVFAISWKNADDSIRGLEWEDYMALGPLDALRVAKSVTGATRVNMVGYCLGGLMLETTLAYLAARRDETPNTATYFAMHQDFSNVGDVAAFISDPEVRFLEWLMDVSGGYLDGRNMAATFNMLRANDLLWHYVINNYLLGKQPPAFDLLYWNSDSTRVPKTVHLYLLRNFFLLNNLVKPDALTLKGVGIDLRRITTPTYCVATSEDHIVPWKGAFKIREYVRAPVRFVLAESGHIAGIINPPSNNKRDYWTNDSDTKNPAEWFAGATKREGSWWNDWFAWLAQPSGKRVKPPALGNDEFPPLMDAPGTYVLEK